MNLQCISAVGDISKYDYIINLFGDSHTLCFVGSSDKNKYIRACYANKNFLIRLKNRDSASMKGLSNVDSKLRYSDYIVNTITRSDNEINVFKLGQVDVECGYYYKTIKTNSNITKIEFYSDIIIKYMSYLRSLDCKNIIVCGINLPALPTTKDLIRYIGRIIDEKDKTLFREVTLNTQIQNCIDFNNMLREQCLANNLKYFDLITESSEYNDGHICLKQEFANKINDQHYNGSSAHIERSCSDPDDYINDINYRTTYYTFLKGLFDAILQ